MNHFSPVFGPMNEKAREKLVRIRAMVERVVDYWNLQPRMNYDDYDLGRYRVAEDIMEILDE
jgi:hypothetical protein